MAARGRTAGFRMSDAHRVKIQNSNILSALIKHVEGKQEMSGSQVQAGLGLLKKVLPDLSTMTIEGNPDKPVSVTEVLLTAAKPRGNRDD